VNTTAILTGPDGKVHEIVRVYDEFWAHPGPIEYNQYRRELDDHIVEALRKNRLIYHYTTLAGFQGIVRDRAIWASDVRTMNDRSEIAYGLGVIRRSVERLFPDLAAVRIIDGVFNPGRVWQFASSFSHSRDQLGPVLNNL
jgi:hypothetical protein